jgi:hypothetical protein
MLFVDRELRHEASHANAIRLLIFPQLVRHLSSVCTELGLSFCLVREQADGATSATRLSPVLA